MKKPQGKPNHHPTAGTFKVFCTLAIMLVFCVNMSAEAALTPLSPRDVTRYGEGEYTYCTTNDAKDMKLDFYPATTGRGKRPIVIMVHGGGFVAGDKTDSHILLPKDQLNELGIAVASVNYRFSSEVTLEYMAGDIKCAIRYLRRYARNFGIDRDRFGIMGSSAGGYLANITAIINEAWDARDYVDSHNGYASDVQSLVSWYGATDVYDYEFDGFPETVKNRLLGSWFPDDATLILASPAEQVDADDPPAKIFNGVDDVVIPPEQAQELFNAYIAVFGEENSHQYDPANPLADGVYYYTELVLVENAGHVFVATDKSKDTTPTRDEIVTQTAEWFYNTLVD